jgi:hypothetical protein
MVDLSESHTTGEAQMPPSRRRRCYRGGQVNASRLFMRLDALIGPGVTKEQFEELFVQCDVCLLITTQSVFRYHKCEVEDSTDEAEETEGQTEDDEV